MTQRLFLLQSFKNLSHFSIFQLNFFDPSKSTFESLSTSFNSTEEIFISERISFIIVWIAVLLYERNKKLADFPPILVSFVKTGSSLPARNNGTAKRSQHKRIGPRPGGQAPPRGQ